MSNSTSLLWQRLTLFRQSSLLPCSRYFSDRPSELDAIAGGIVRAGEALIWLSRDLRNYEEIKK